MLYILTTKEKIFKRLQIRELKEICIFIHLIKHGHDWGNNSHGGIKDVVGQHA